MDTVTNIVYVIKGHHYSEKLIGVLMKGGIMNKFKIKDVSSEILKLNDNMIIPCIISNGKYYYDTNMFIFIDKMIQPVPQTVPQTAPISDGKRSFNETSKMTTQKKEMDVKDIYEIANKISKDRFNCEIPKPEQKNNTIPVKTQPIIKPSIQTNSKNLKNLNNTK